MEVSGQLHVLVALPPVEGGPSTLCIGGWADLESVWKLMVKGKNPLSRGYIA
jgi:hypothetical protein